MAQKKPRGAEWAVAEQVPQAVQPGVGGWPWVGGSSRGWGVMERPGAERAYAGIGRDPAWRRRLRAASMAFCRAIPIWASDAIGHRSRWAASSRGDIAPGLKGATRTPSRVVLGDLLPQPPPMCMLALALCAL